MELQEIVDKMKMARREIPANFERRVAEAAHQIVFDMQQELFKNGSVETGELVRSCHSEIAESSEDKVVANIYADAKSTTTATFANGDTATWGPTAYANFVEYGTGVKRDPEAVTGMERQTPWRYFDAFAGVWRTTVGSKPHPFIRPAKAKNEEKVKEEIFGVFNLKKYIGG